MDSTHPTTGDDSSKQHLWERNRISQLVEQIRSDQLDGASLNQSASMNDVARKTAQIWIRNRCRPPATQTAWQPENAQVSIA